MAGNFRANDYGMTGPEADLIARIKAGTTETQRSQAFMDKLLMGGGQAILGLAGHIGQGLDAADQERRAAAKRKVVGPKPSNLPDWLQATSDPQTAAELAAANQKVNASAANASIGGTTTRDGDKNQEEQSSMLGRDQQMGKSLMSDSANPYGTEAPSATWGVPQAAPAPQAEQTWGDGGRGMMGSIGPEEDYDYYAGQNKG